MKYQTLFTGKNKKNMINVPFAEFAKRVVVVRLTSSQSKLSLQLEAH